MKKQKIFEHEITTEINKLKNKIVGLEELEKKINNLEKIKKEIDKGKKRNK